MKGTRVGIAVGLVVFLTAMGGGASYALWNTTATTAAQVKAATVAMAVDGAAATSALSVPYLPGEAFTSAITISNSGTAAFTYNITVVPNGGTLSHSSVAIALWKAASTCTDTSTVPTDAWSGTLATLAAHGSEAMAVSGSQVLCVRITLSGTVTSAQNGQSASANLILTATNGWVTSASVPVTPSVRALPNPVLLDGKAGCSDTTSQKTVTVGWTTVSGASEYRVYFTPKLSSGPAFLTVPQPPAGVIVVGTSIVGESFDTIIGSSQGSGSVSIRSVVGGSESTGLVVPVYFAPNSSGNNTKISCTPFPR